jgi:hypothetical protein
MNIDCKGCFCQSRYKNRCEMIWIHYMCDEQIKNLSEILSEICICRDCLVKGTCDLRNHLNCQKFMEILEKKFQQKFPLIRVK